MEAEAWSAENSRASTPSELSARLDRILVEAERMIALVPDQRIRLVSPPDDRSAADLAYHLFRLSVALVDAMDRGRFVAEWLRERVPADLTDGRAIARYGALVRGRVSGWFDGAGSLELSRVIAGRDGARRADELLEQTTRHAAYHLRQLHAKLGAMGLTPEPLPADLGPASSQDL